MIERGQGSLEYLIIIAAVLVVAGVVVMFIAGSVGAGKESALYAACQEATVKCNAQRLANPMDPCNFCNAACSDPTTGKEIFWGAIECCTKGNQSMIYIGSEGCGDPPECRPETVNEDCLAYEGNECISSSCVDYECVYSEESAGSPCTGGVCDGAGTCLFHECSEHSDCDDGNDCTNNMCNPGPDGVKRCVETDKDAGVSCADGFGQCDGAGTCDFHECVSIDMCGDDGDTGNTCTVFECNNYKCEEVLIAGADGSNNVLVREDKDNDGRGVGTSFEKCIGDTIPSGFCDASLTMCQQTDCNDNDPDRWEYITVCLDRDGDGRGATSSGSQTGCYGTSATYPISTEGTYRKSCNDCDDFNNLIWRNVWVRTDADNDGYGVGNAFQLCIGNDIPSGYCDENSWECRQTDCNDNNAAINPGATEICDDGIDNNCNGLIDCADTTACGATLACNLAPTASFTYSCNKLSCSFTDQSTDPNPGATLTYSWNFGDGTTSTAKNPSKTYTYSTVNPSKTVDSWAFTNVTLTVTDNHGAVSSTRQSISATKWDTNIVTGQCRKPSLHMETPTNPIFSCMSSSVTYVFYSSNGGTSWTNSAVDQKGSNDHINSLSFSTYPHVAFVNNGGLYHATPSGGGWSVSRRGSTSVTIGDMSMALIKSNNRPRICYYDLTNHDLRLTGLTAVGWLDTAVDTAGDVGSKCSVEVDSLGSSHIGYYDNTNGNFKYARVVDNSWVITGIQGANAGQSNSLKVASDNKVHTAISTEGKHVLYSIWQDGAVSSNFLPKIVSTNDVGSKISMALDSNNRPHICVYDSTSKEIHYAHYTGSSWTLDRVFHQYSNSNPIQSCSIAVDSNNKPHITIDAGYDGSNRAIHYIRLK